MQRIKLGRSDLEVSRICFGTWQFGGDWGSLDEQENVDAMHRALELGVNFFDTAQAYGFGASEHARRRRSATPCAPSATRSSWPPRAGCA